MFSDLEAAIKAHLAGVVPGVDVLGTWDRIDFSADGAPRMAVQVEYQGFDALQNKPRALTIAQQFAAHVWVDAGRVRDADRASAEAGLLAIIERMIAWPGPLECQVQSSPVMQADGPTMRLTISFTLAPVVVEP